MCVSVCVFGGGGGARGGPCSAHNGRQGQQRPLAPHAACEVVRVMRCAPHVRPAREREGGRKEGRKEGRRQTRGRRRRGGEMDEKEQIEHWKGRRIWTERGGAGNKTGLCHVFVEKGLLEAGQVVVRKSRAQSRVKSLQLSLTKTFTI